MACPRPPLAPLIRKVRISPSMESHSPGGGLAARALPASDGKPGTESLRHIRRVASATVGYQPGQARELDRRGFAPKIRHEARPARGGGTIKIENREALHTGREPSLEALPTTAGRQEKNPVLDFSKNHRVDHEVEFLGTQPREHPRVWGRAGGLAQDVGIHEESHPVRGSRSTPRECSGTSPFRDIRAANRPGRGCLSVAAA